MSEYFFALVGLLSKPRDASELGLEMRASEMRDIFEVGTGRVVPSVCVPLRGFRVLGFGLRARFSGCT